MNKYKQVYFRIMTPSYYRKGVGFQTLEDNEKFHRFTLDLFLNAGWHLEGKEVKPGSGHCDEVYKGKQELYLHPQSISGIVEESQITEIENILHNNDVFRLEKTDIYEDVFDLSDDEYLKTLESKRSEIEEDLLVAFKTKRRNLFITSIWTIIEKVLAKYKIKRVSSYVGVYSSDDLDYKFINGLFKSLVDSKRIVTGETRNGLGYRTA